MPGNIEATVYVKANQHKIVVVKRVALGKAVELETAKSQLKRELENLLLYDFEGKNKNVKVFSMMDIIKLIQGVHPLVQVVNLGETDFILEYRKDKSLPKEAFMEKLRLVVLCLLTFFGAAFSVLAFNNDISILGVFEQFYMQNIGTKKPAISELEICYSLGIAVGILVFFNHVGRKKITPDPTPIQVEMRKYLTDQNNTFIENEERKEQS